MARLGNGSNGHVNGDHSTNNVNQYQSLYRDGGPITVGRELRAAGYGGFDPRDGNLSVPQDTDLETSASTNGRPFASSNGYDSLRHGYIDRGNGDWQNTSRSRDRDGVQNASSSYGNGPGGRQIEDVLQHINDKWDIMTKEECVPVYVALQLMDQSSLGRGREYQDFQRTSRHLQKALRSIVNEHHQGFNTSIGTFHKIQSSIHMSQTRVRSLRESVSNAKSSLIESKPEMQDLGTSSQKYESMLHILSQIEKLQMVPDLLDARIADKQFLAAVDLLQDALRIVRKSEMENIGALSDLRVYFSNQETINNESTSNVQADSFRYMHTLLEALDKLGCLDIVVDRIEQRLPVELFAIVDRTNQEVDLRHPLHLRESSRLEDALLQHNLSDAKGSSDVLDDLLWTLYSKFEAIAEGHRVVHDVIMGIARRNGVRRPENLASSFREMWKLYQSERVFKLAEVDQKSSDFPIEQADLDKILQSSVPGLVLKSQRRSGTHSRKDRVSKGGPATHKLLTESSVFNIAILLPPSLSFLQRLKDIVPPDSDIAISTLTSFLDDFLVNVFLPQLEETVTELCEESYVGFDAFQQDPCWQQEAARPILKLKPAAAMTQTGELRDILKLHQDRKHVEKGPMIQKQWLATGLIQIRHVVPEAKVSKRGSTRPQQTRRWTLLGLNKPASDKEPLHLPMTHEAAATFDGIVTSIRDLALDALFTLQVDIRCGVAHMTAQMLKTPYLLSYPTNNPDSNVLSLNSDLLSFDDALSAYLPSAEHRFITAGLGAFVDTFLVAHASLIPSMNANGCGRMQLNILVLQQNLKSIEGDVSLSRSAHFFELFMEGAEAFVARAKMSDPKDYDFTLEERKALVELCHSEGLQSAQRESSAQARKRLTELLKQLED
ncbi:MAG: hypothetical protein Q9170_002758 [Blastenia crenularia]